jgi:hypothetical protein
MSGSFSAWSPPNPACEFPRTGLSSSYGVSGGGVFWWMLSWQARQTTRVLRRLRGMTAAHAEPGSARARSARARTWWTSMSSGDPHSSHVPRRSREMISLCGYPTRGGWRSSSTAVFRLVRGDTAEPGDQWLPVRPVDLRLVACASPARGVDVCPVTGGHLDH